MSTLRSNSKILEFFAKRSCRQSPAVQLPAGSFHLCCRVFTELMVRAQQKANSVIDELSKSHTSPKPLDKPALLKHCLLLELLKWFKTEFFRWFDRENCTACGDLSCVPVRHTILAAPTADERLFGGDRIEVYQCPQCQQHYRFPRYNDPLKLLETRRGRCGEWANAFTLCCRACGFDARFVLDFTDHVWTEVWSDLEGRWLHCDPCENVCDKPLLYEAGWGKELSYVFAFSRVSALENLRLLTDYECSEFRGYGVLLSILCSQDELVDVTWRYTSKPLVLKRRRTLMNESQLLSQIQSLNSSYFTPVVPSHRANLALQRRVGEVVEFLNCTSRTAADAEQHGRSSGSLAWRLARGETTTANASSGSNLINKNFVFKLDEKPIDADVATIRVEYDVVDNKYAVYHNNHSVQSHEQWVTCTYAARNVDRKEEQDWKMVYLCRADGSDAGIDGKIEWRFSVPFAVDKKNGESSTNFTSGKVFVQARNTACFETGLVKWNIAVLDDSNNADEKLSEASKDADKNSAENVLKRVDVESSALENGYDCGDLFSGIADNRKTLTLSVCATLSGGQGNIGWQQAQLFRSSTKTQLENKDKAAQFIVTFQLGRS